MQSAFYGPLGNATVPEHQRWFATPDRLPHFAERIAELKQAGAELTVISGSAGFATSPLGAPLRG